VSAKQGQRQQWLGDHAETFAYRDQLLNAVAERRHELGFRAAITQPVHVVDIIGAVPTDSPEATRRWINFAARIEAYREEWAVAPERLRERPWDACQQRAWDRRTHHRTPGPTGAGTHGRAERGPRDGAGDGSRVVSSRGKSEARLAQASTLSCRVGLLPTAGVYAIDVLASVETIRKGPV
jgi:hypothetical protein